MTANISSPNPTLSSSQGVSHRNPRPIERQEYILRKRWRFGKKYNWQAIVACAMCGADIPEWRNYLRPRFCSACEDKLDKVKYQ